MRNYILVFIIFLIILSACSEKTDASLNKTKTKSKNITGKVHPDTLTTNRNLSASGFADKVKDTIEKKKSKTLTNLDRFEKRLSGKWEHYESYVEGAEGTSVKGKKEQLNFLPGRRMKIIRNRKMIEDTYRLREFEWGLPEPSIILRRETTGEEWEVYIEKKGAFEYLYMKMPLVADGPVDMYRRSIK